MPIPTCLLTYTFFDFWNFFLPIRLFGLHVYTEVQTSVPSNAVGEFFCLLEGSGTDIPKNKRSCQVRFEGALEANENLTAFIICCFYVNKWASK